MIKRQTVFVLGAGAGNPYNFPTGMELTKEVCQACWQTGEEEARNLSRVFDSDAPRKARELADKLSRSGILIDEWLATNPEYQPLGKYFIAKQIMQRESEERFKEAFVNRDEDWYSILWQRMLSPERKIENLINNQVAFITFNYDRSLEQNFMMRALNTFVGISAGDCANQIARVPIIHVHGQLGRLPWQDATKDGFKHLNGMTERLFESQQDPNVIRACSQHIKIIAETNGGTPEYERAKVELKKAERVHFLGFGYHDENLLRLKQEGYSNPHLQMYGTCLRVEEWKIQRLGTRHNPFGFLVTARKDLGGVANYFFHAVEGWDEYRQAS